MSTRGVYTIMVKKNVLLASAALMTLGMAGSVNADEKATSEAVVVATAPEKELKTVAEVPAKEESKASEAAPVAEEKKAETPAKEEVKSVAFSDDYNNTIDNFADKFINGTDGLEETMPLADMELDAYLNKFYFDVIALRDEVKAYTDKNGVSDDAKELLAQINEYLDAVAPTMDLMVDVLNDLADMTPEQLEAAINEIMGLFKEEDQLLDATADNATVSEKQAEVAPINAPVETLPETGSDAKSYISVIGAALAGLTVWGFGFKKRG